jgi:putative membrane-bound dehydrogenase-like protein
VEALKHMKVADGFQVKLVASEPDIRKPVTITFDDRGRMWVIQYLQYPNPAGLKPVKVDQYLRTVYDRVPEPPPKGPKGADRITILEDPDENGRFRKVKDFHVGLNLASGMCLGYGGVFVAQPPYLLYYPDNNGDDVPDGDPEVLLEGFGMEDSHAFANSLQWGPDGWLYGAHGSTVTAKIRGIEFQQGIWRYHPVTKEFELFAEGGGNTWGLDFDRHGQIIAGTNWGGNACLHQVQGAYYVKGFAKHGPLHNPYTFGYFEHIPYTGFKGGHVTVGGIVYQGGAFPEQFANQYIASNLLSNALYWHQLERKGSSFTARWGGELITSDDRSFRPVDCLTGPDGAVYLADWADLRANHVDPVDNWDRTRGRIWKLEHAERGVNTPRSPRMPLSKLTSKELVDLLSHANSWYRREARRILAERRDASVIPTLRKMIDENKDNLALEALWALYVSGGLDDLLASQLLAHSNEDVRTWIVRLLGDAKKVSPMIRDKLPVQAAKDESPRVRSQLACSAKRLPAKDGLPIVRELLKWNQDANDQHIPLLLWWAIEDKARDAVSFFKYAEARQVPLVQTFILERLARRFMAAEAYGECGGLVRELKNSPDLGRVLAGMEKALEGRSLAEDRALVLRIELSHMWPTKANDPTFVRLMLRLSDRFAFSKALDVVRDPKTPPSDLVSLIEILGQLGKPDCVPIFLQLFRESPNAKIRQAALTALQSFSDPTIFATVLELYPKLPADLRNRSRDLLCSRQASALEFLKLVDAGKIDKKEVPLDQLQRVVAYKDEQIQKLVEKHWGKVGPQSSGEKQSRMRSIAHILRQGKGDPVKGRELYVKHCATCHVLFNEGNKVGPELTGADRKNLDFLLLSTVDPSAFIRPEFVAWNVATKDGRVLTGLIAEDAAKAVTVLDAKNERTVVAKDAIEELTPSPASLMPEKILDPLSDQEIRDFFAYVRGDGPVAPKPVPSPLPLDPQGRGGDKEPLKVLLISGSLEYKSDESLAEFQKYLEANYNVKCLRAFRKTDTDIPGLEQLDSCDVALFYTRRLQLEGEQLERIKKYCRSGKPIVALRTASHGFQKWLEMDKEILGGNYSNHYKEGPICEVKFADKGKEHPVLAGVKEFKSVASLYKNPNIAKDCEVLLTGSIPGNSEPLAWTRVVNGGRVFYTSLGHLKDFEDDNFRRLLVNALFWTAKRTVVKK